MVRTVNPAVGRLVREVERLERELHDLADLDSGLHVDVEVVLDPDEVREDRRIARPAVEGSRADFARAGRDRELSDVRLAISARDTYVPRIRLIKHCEIERVR